jgi:hypothetical protein
LRLDVFQDCLDDLRVSDVGDDAHGAAHKGHKVMSMLKTLLSR